MRCALLILLALTVSACGGGAVDYTKLPKAPARAMVPPVKVEPPVKGDDLDEKHAALLRQYEVEIGKLRVLQARERTLQGK